MTILSFCACCGVLLPEGLGKEPNPICPNCSASVKDIDTGRLEGQFTDEHARKLVSIVYGDDEEITP